MSATSPEPTMLASEQVYVSSAAESLSNLGRRRKFVSWTLMGILTVFWIYVTLSNILYAGTLGAGLDPTGAANFFAPWTARVLQHVLLYPVLIGCMWASLRVRWKPLWRALPIQILLGVMFSGLATPLLAVSERLVDPIGWNSHDYMKNSVDAFLTQPRLSLWVAGATNFELTYGFAVALITGFVFYRRSRDSELRVAALERAWSDARLGALRAQLSPHTLFNLLHTIRGQIGWDPPAAQNMIVQFGELLRSLLTAGQREFSRLRDELQFARLYLELQQKRFADRLTLSLPDVEALPSVWVPSLILQPLVENAVVHGVAGHEGPVTIRVHVEKSEAQLVLRVVNTVVPNRVREREGIGLRNVRERLTVHFGRRVAFSAGLTPLDEWMAEIRMPLLYERPGTDRARNRNDGRDNRRR